MKHIITAWLLALADRIEFPYGVDVPPLVRRDVEGLRDIAEWVSCEGA